MSDRVIEMDKRLFEQGVVKASYRAAIHCALEGKPIPEWAVPTVVEALQRDFVGANGRGKGVAAPYISSTRARRQMAIVDEVNRLNRDHKIPKKKAFELVAEQFNKFVVDGKVWTSEMIRKNYYPRKNDQ